MTNYGEMALRAAEAAQGVIDRQHRLNDEAAQEAMNKIVREHDKSRRQIDAGFGEDTTAPTPTSTEPQGQPPQQPPAPARTQSSDPAPDQAQEPTTPLVPPPPAPEPAQRHPLNPRGWGWTLVVWISAIVGGVFAFFVALVITFNVFSAEEFDGAARAWLSGLLIVALTLLGFFAAGAIANRISNNREEASDA